MSEVLDQANQPLRAHYMPIMKCKAGELWALQNLPIEVRDRCLPLMELIDDTDDGFNDAGLPARINQLASRWESDHGIGLDTLHHETGDLDHDGTLMATVLQAAEDAGLNAIPTLRLSHPPSVLEAINNASVTANGVIVRLRPEDFTNTNVLVDTLQASLEFISVEPGDVDIVIDVVNAPPVATLQQIYQTQVSQLPEHDWRTITVSAGSFPNTLADRPVDEWVEVPRHEWMAYGSARGGGGFGNKTVSFGDYVTRDPGLPPRFGRGTANVRYALNDVWLCRRSGRSGQDMRNICVALTSDARYAGPTYSEGDSEFYRVASQSQNSGNATSWVKWSQSHHVVKCVNQVVNF